MDHSGLEPETQDLYWMYVPVSYSQGWFNVTGHEGIQELDYMVWCIARALSSSSSTPIMQVNIK